MSGLPGEHALHCGKEAHKKIDGSHGEQRRADADNTPMEHHRCRNCDEVDKG